MNISNSAIYLKKLTLKYVNDFKNLFNDPYSCRCLSIPYPLPNTWIRNYISDAMEHFKTGNKYTWGVFQQSSHDLVGIIVLREINQKNKSAQLGYSVGKKFWNNGYTSMAMQLVIDYAFQKLKLNRIEIRIDVEDNRSRKILKEFKGHEEGILRQANMYNDSYKDIALFSILKNEYYTQKVIETFPIEQKQAIC